MVARSSRPDFVGIGAPKCGTTWAAQVLRAHSQIEMAAGKELSLFSSEKKWSWGTDWYFQAFPEPEAGQTVGEFSVSYMTRADVVAERIKNTVPDVKMIAILRDPVARAQSHWRWLGQLDKQELLTDNRPSADHPVVHDSLYYARLSPFRALFPRDQIMIIKYEDLASRPYEGFRQIFEFLGVNPSEMPSNVGRSVGKTISPRSRLLESARINTVRALRRAKLTSVITLVQDLGLSNFYRRINDSGDTGSVSSLDLSSAAPALRADLDELEHVCGFDVSDWKTKIQQLETNR